MAGFIYEFFGFSADDNSHASRLAVAQRNCPFLNSACVKRFHDGEPAGVCAVRQKSKGAPPIICCPNRLYADRYKVLYDITKDAFGKNFKLYAGRSAVEKAKIEKGAVAVC
ncbi:MAG: NotI family restriction endonuclease, partial [Kiritimatiellae bacterium]|nr:NotI family restriction endonuclease [Kiritimatiellia bacterium]